MKMYIVEYKKVENDQKAVKGAHAIEVQTKNKTKCKILNRLFNKTQNTKEKNKTLINVNGSRKFDIYSIRMESGPGSTCSSTSSGWSPARCYDPVTCLFALTCIKLVRLTNYKK